VKFGEQDKDEKKDSPGKEPSQDPISEHFYTPGSVRNILSWGDQPIHQPVEEVANLESFAYDRKRRSIVKRTQRKRKITLDNSVLCTFEEVIINTKKEKMSQLFSVGLVISHASLDKVVAKERELEQVKQEVASLKYQVQYYQEARWKRI
jgi:hypothetical protein